MVQIANPQRRRRVRPSSRMHMRMLRATMQPSLLLEPGPGSCRELGGPWQE